MTTVRSVVHPGWIEVVGPGVHAVVAAADRHAETLAAAASRGLLPLLEALTAHGISGAPDFVVAAPGETGVRVLVRGAGAAVLPDGTRIGSDGRMPWSDVDVDPVAAGDEVSVEAPAPEVPRGWRRPARLGRGAAAGPAAGVATVLGAAPQGQPEPGDTSRGDDRPAIDQLGDLGSVDEHADAEADEAVDDEVGAGAPVEAGGAAARPDAPPARRRPRPPAGGARPGIPTAARWPHRRRPLAPLRRAGHRRDPAAAHRAPCR